MTRFKTADSVQAREVEFIWRNRIPRGKMTFIAGRPDEGKGLCVAMIASDVSTDKSLNGGRGGRVIYSASEDDEATMTRPRLEAAGANLRNIMLGSFTLPEDMVELAHAVRELKADMIVIDPLADHLGRGVSRGSESIRKVSKPLKKLAEDTGVAIVVVDHLPKKVPSNVHPMAAVGGSGSGFPAACRVGYVFGTDPDSPEQKGLMAVKTNVLDREAATKALFFEVDEGELPALERAQPFLVFDSTRPIDPIKLIASHTPRDKVGRPDAKRAQACEWLTNYLAAAGKPVKAQLVYEDAKQAGMTSRTLLRASNPPPEGMGVVKRDKNGKPAGGRDALWSLPDEVLALLGQAKKSAKANGKVEQPGKVVANVPDPKGGKGKKADAELEGALAELLGGGGE